MNIKIKNLLKSKEFLIFILSFSIIWLFAGKLIGESSISRLATIKSVVENHTWSIENAKDFDTIDKIFYNNHFYSSKPPLPSIIGSLIYFVVRGITGLNISEHLFFYNHIINGLTNGLSFALIILFFYKSLKWFGLEEKYKILLTPIVGFGTLLFTYSTIFHNHVIGAFLLFLSFYYLLKIKFENNKKIYFILCGFFLSLAIITEIIQSVIFLLIILLYLTIKKDTRNKVYLFILGGLPIAILYIIYNFYTNGTIFPPYFNFESLYGYPGSYWLNPTGSDKLQHNRLFYLFNILFGIQGLFLYTPILIFGFWGMVKAIKEKNEKWSELAKVILFICLSNLTFLFIATDNYGGASYGLRWFVVYFPCILFFIPILIKYFENKKFLFWFLCISFISFIFSFIGTGRWVINVREIYGVKLYFPLVDTAYRYLIDFKSQF